MSLSRRLFVKIPSLALLGAVSPVFASGTSEIKLYPGLWRFQFLRLGL